MHKSAFVFSDPADYFSGFCESEVSPVSAGIPLFFSSDRDLETVYRYRAESYFRHIKKTEDGYIVTEFLPDVPWAGKHNTINCALGHHLYEGRWIHHPIFLDEYTRWWFAGGNVRQYSCWFADAILARADVTGDYALAKELYGNLKENYAGWVAEKGQPNGLFSQDCNYDGMEYSASGIGMRPTINSYLYGDLRALEKIAAILGLADEVTDWGKKADVLRTQINTLLWNDNKQFYLTRYPDGTLSSDREECGYLPWYFSGLADESKSTAWQFLVSKEHFCAPYGPTTLEQCSKEYMHPYPHECLWNGPSWPYATAQTATALARLIRETKQNVMGKSDWFRLFKTYTDSQFIRDENGEVVPFIDEELDPATGEWLTRKILHAMVPRRGDRDRGVHYNHSTYCDLVITGLCGIVPMAGNVLTVDPLFSGDDLSDFLLDGVRYHDHNLTVLYDRDGTVYNKGKGLTVYLDGKVAAKSDTLLALKITL